ncbi:unnamed protein product [Cuscuta epithymum]|uniref:glycerophosphodiester phosphodiesterase n=1 Tax=Cuscuta epithymum TaxID=186058 RepID=A0AAV0BZ40_9ASTE|nr:unnamed protein product [Cuscuta epithymum]
MTQPYIFHLPAYVKNLKEKSRADKFSDRGLAVSTSWDRPSIKMAVRAVPVSEMHLLDNVPENDRAKFCLPTSAQGGGENGNGEGRRGVKMWKEKEKRFVVMGHRGNGMNMLELSDRRMKAIRENTIRSFLNAGKLGLDFVEFDVQGLIIEKRVTDLTLDEFLSYGPQRSAENVGKPIYRKTKGGTIFEWAVEDDDHLCILKDVFQSVNDSLGFNIELKFDNNRVYTEAELVRVIQVIMKVVLDDAKERVIMFSTFHPDAALLIRKLQNLYPVFFLSNGGNEIHSDTRRNSLEEAVKLCLAGGLQGIVSEVKAILRNPSAINKIKDSHLSLITYGQLNNVGEVVYMQRNMGVEGVIVDVVEEIMETVSELNDTESGERGQALCIDEKTVLTEKMDRHCSKEEILCLFSLLPLLLHR